MNAASRLRRKSRARCTRVLALATVIPSESAISVLHRLLGILGAARDPDGQAIRAMAVLLDETLRRGGIPAPQRSQQLTIDVDACRNRLAPALHRPPDRHHRHDRPPTPAASRRIESSTRLANSSSELTGIRTSASSSAGDRRSPASRLARAASTPNVARNLSSVTSFPIALSTAL